MLQALKMENSVRPTIERIKLQEQDNEIKLREKREFNAAILSLNRAIQETSLNIEKFTKEHQTLISSTDKLQAQLIVEKTRQSALADQVKDCQKELDELRKISVSQEIDGEFLNGFVQGYDFVKINGVCTVWEKRSKIINTIQSTSDKCDIWALLIKPRFEIKPNIIQAKNIDEIVFDDTKLKIAIERRDKAIATRDFLLTEPDVGEEFVRTRNALQYSLEIVKTEENE